MSNSTKPNSYRLTGALFIIAFILFATGAALPLLGAKGNPSFYGLSASDFLLAISKNPDGWYWSNIAMGAASLLLLAGMTLLSTFLEGENEHIFSRLGQAGILLAVILWMIQLTYNVTVSVAAAQEMVAKTATPANDAQFDQWMEALFFVYALVAFLGLIGYGVALLRVHIVPVWAGWTTLIFSLAMLILLLVTGDMLPAFHYFPPLLIGILLILRR